MVTRKHDLKKHLTGLNRKVHRLEVEGKWDEAMPFREKADEALAELVEARRADRVQRRRSRIARNAAIYAGGMRITHPVDVAYMLRLCIEIDRAYFPDSYVKAP